MTRRSDTPPRLDDRDRLAVALFVHAPQLADPVGTADALLPAVHEIVANELRDLADILGGRARRFPEPMATLVEAIAVGLAGRAAIVMADR